MKTLIAYRQAAKTPLAAGSPPFSKAAALEKAIALIEEKCANKAITTANDKIFKHYDTEETTQRLLTRLRQESFDYLNTVLTEKKTALAELKMGGMENSAPSRKKAV